MNHSLKRFFKITDSFTNEASDCVFEEIIESFTQTILQNSWFIYKWSKWLCFWINHWIIHSNDSSKQLIHLQMKQVTVFLNKSLNHSLKRFFKITDSFTNEASDCVFEEIIESFTQTILQNSWFIYKWSKWLCFWINHWIIHSNDLFKKRFLKLLLFIVLGVMVL